MCWCRSLGPELPVLLYFSLCDDDDTRQDCYYITINALSPRIIYIYQRCLRFKCPMRTREKERSSKEIQSLIARKRQSRQRISAKSMRFPFLRQSFNPCGTFWALFYSFLITMVTTNQHRNQEALHYTTNIISIPGRSQISINPPPPPPHSVSSLCNNYTGRQDNK